MNCKEGDDALVIKTVACHENFGRKVQVIRRSRSTPSAWSCAAHELVGIDKATGKKRRCQFMVFGDAQLFPLRPGPAMEREIAVTERGELA